MSMIDSTESVESVESTETVTSAESMESVAPTKRAPKVLVTARSFGNVTEKPMQLLQESGCEVVIPPGRVLNSFAEMLPYLSDITAMIISREKITDEVFANAPNLQIVVKHGVGVDNIDLAAAAKRGIIVANTPGANKLSVAELAVNGMLALSRQLLYANQSVRQGRWETLMGQNLSQKTVGIVGLGNIGSSTARLLRGFGCRLLAYDPYISAEKFAAVGATSVSYEQLVQESDHITLHVPLTRETYHMVDQVVLAGMKESAFLINLARGGVVDELALADALQNGQIAGAVVDVFEQEPPDTSHPLFQAPNTLFTPHMGAHSRESMNNMSVMAATNVVEVLQGRACPHPVTAQEQRNEGSV